ncbi:MAG: DNA internalization-related competence protein ComEC/Rec2 [Lachnospiraceae bacterium]|nr:DNA internalization-related competence protein ComEC/Rec2 [Lachnospiraceae bacterium]
MQIRRPLCLLSLIFVLLVMCCVYGAARFKEPLPEEGETITLTGIVKNKEYRVMYGEEIPVLYVSSVEDKNDRQVMCYMKDAGDSKTIPRMGETVRVSGKVSLFREASNPGEFDLKEYYQILNISYKLNQTEILERSESCYPLKEKLYQIKCRCCKVLDEIYPEKEASVLKAMLLGEKNGLDEEAKELYQLNGLIHILAISGLHVSLLGVAVSGGLKKCGMPVWLRGPAAAGVMWCYGMMTGMGVSTWRAIFMFTLHLAAELFGRTYDMLTALSLAAAFMLAEQPLLVWHSGFLLSFGAVLGIGLVLPWWKEVLERLTGIRTVSRKEEKEKRPAGGAQRLQRKLTNTVINGICLGSAIMITTLPVLFYFYYKYPVYSLVLNLYVIPLMSVVFAGGVFSLAAGFLQPGAGVLAGMPDRLILWLYEVSCRETLKLPGAVNIGGRPEVWQIAVYYGILCFLIFRYNLTEEKSEGKTEKGCGALSALNQWLLILGIMWLLLIRPVNGFSVSFLDVGQGDCIVMRNDNGNCYMVDGGSTSKSKVGKYQMLPFLESAGIRELEAVFLTHPDEDHISGVVEMMEQSVYGVRINSLILPDVSPEMKEKELVELINQAAQYDIPVYYIARGDCIQDDKLKFTCLGPEKGVMTDEVNEISTVIYTEYGEFTMLLTGDVTGEAEKELLSQLAEREKLTVLKVAHHGSKYSTPQEFLEMTDPVYAIISAGKDNRYGHPHEELIERLEKQGCYIYRTTESGAVTMKVRRGRIRVEEFLR